MISVDIRHISADCPSLAGRNDRACLPPSPPPSASAGTESQFHNTEVKLSMDISHGVVIRAVSLKVLRRR